MTEELDISRVPFLATGDLHAHNHRSFARTLEDGTNSRLQVAIECLMEMKNQCLRRGVRNMVIIGDLFHLRGLLPVDVMVAVKRTIASISEAGIMVYIIGGNHDQARRNRGDLVSIEALSDIPNVMVVTEPTVIEHRGWVMIPYSEDKEKVCEFALAEARKDRVLFAHLGMGGAVTGPNDHVMTDQYSPEDLGFSKYGLVLLGHYHKYQKIGKNGYYVGSPYQLDFGESGQDKGYVVVLEDLTIEFVESMAPQFRYVTIDTYFQWNNYDYFRVEVNERSDPEYVSRLQELSNVELVWLRDQEERNERSTIDLSMSDHKVLSVYVVEQTGRDDEALIQLGMDILQEVAK